MTSPVSSWGWSPEHSWGSQTHPTLHFIFPALRRHLLCDTLDLLLLWTAIYFPSYKFITLLLKARLHSHALLLCFLTDLICSPQISSLGWFKGSTSPFPCEPSQCCILASPPCCCVRAAPAPRQPLPCSLNEPIFIPFSVYGHPSPLSLIIFLYACFSCRFTFI